MIVSAWIGSCVTAPEISYLICHYNATCSEIQHIKILSHYKTTCPLPNYCPFQATWPRDFFYPKKTTQLRLTISPQRVNRIHRKGHRWTQKNSRKMIISDQAVKDHFSSYRFFGVRRFIVHKFTDLLTFCRHDTRAENPSLSAKGSYPTVEATKMIKSRSWW